MIKIAVAGEKPQIVDGVKEGFESIFINEEVKVSFFQLNAQKKRELVEGEVFKAAENKMSNLKKIIKEKAVTEDFDYFTVIQDGLFSKGGKFFYEIIASIEYMYVRKTKMLGISSGLMIHDSENKLLYILNNKFTNAVSDADLKVITKLNFSYNTLAKQAVQMALSAYNW